MEVEESFCPPFTQIPSCWLNYYGYSYSNPNEANLYLSEVSSMTSTQLITYFYFIKKNVLGETINKWAPFDPNKLSFKYGSIGILENPTSSGILSHNEIWCGIHTILGNVTVPSGVTLTIQPGTTVKFYDNASLYVNGTLIAEGTEDQPISFTSNRDNPASGAWGSIQFNDSSNDNECIIKYADIQYASYGVYCDHASPTIEHNSFSNNGYALYLYNASPSVKSNRITNDRVYTNYSNAYFYNNYISNSTDTYPFYLYFSSPSLYHNTIKGGYITSKAYYYSSPRYGSKTSTTAGYNIIDQDGSGEFALIAENHSNPFLGSTDMCLYERRGGYNTVRGDDQSTLALVQATNYSTVDAQYTWWGEYPCPTDLLSTDGSSSIDYAHALTTDPGGGSSLGKRFAAAGNSQLAEWPAPLDSTSLSSIWSWARYYTSSGLTDKAINLYSLIIRKFSDNPKAQLALTYIIGLSDKSPQFNLRAFLEGQSANPLQNPDLRAAAKDALVMVLNHQKQPQAAVQLGSQLLQELPHTQYEYTTLFNLFNIYQKDMKDESDAGAMLEQLKTRYPDYELTLIAQYDMGEKVNWKKPKHFAMSPGMHQAKQSLPESYELGVNYPNPFNPSTVIPFALPEESPVRIEIYDILGRRVATLTNTKCPAGFNRVVWDGQDQYGKPVSAGIYIYRMTAGKFSKARKLLLLK
ncbi:MAG: T9SS type A sorting domain-containing protein [Nitrospiraceae bacterium]|nr:T9SS type A sorting domain-containing protein [Nitrospiraceae bacterium]